MKNAAAGHKGFLAFAIIALFVSTLLHLFFNIREHVDFAAYPYNEAFYEEAITAASDYVQALPKVVPVGITAGVRFYTDGIMVLDIDSITTAQGNQESPSQGKLAPGDILKKANGTTILNHSQLSSAIGQAAGNVSLEIVRDGQTHNIDIAPVICKDDNRAKIGCWVRDSTQGIGTITYYEPQSGRFGALGHGIMDVDVNQLLSVRHGHMMESHIIDVVKGKKGNPGELIGEIKSDVIIGTIKKNTPLGLYGDINPNYQNMPKTALTAARHSQITQGPAKIFSNIEGDGIKTYDVYIENVNKDADADKGMVVRITDQGLITRTNGIVQGMSGSPIVQNDRVLGAITHVFVQNPLRGYGVTIEKMMSQDRASANAFALFLNSGQNLQQI